MADQFPGPTVTLDSWEAILLVVVVLLVNALVHDWHGRVHRDTGREVPNKYGVHY